MNQKKSLFTRSLCFGFAVALTFAVSGAARAEITDKDFNSAMEKYLKSESGQKALGSTIETYFQERQRDAMKKQEEQAQAEMENQFKNPVKMDPGTSPAKGPADAKVTVIEFSDFQCPYCKRGYETMEALAKAYPKDVKIVFKHFPLPFHDQAEPASRASWAAQKQGKFWEYHDALFKNQDKLSPEYYMALAKELKLDADKFKKDMESEEAKKAVKDDMELGSKNGIQGTPGFFVNGVAVKGAYPVEHFKTIVDRWLQGGTAPKKG